MKYVPFVFVSSRLDHCSSLNTTELQYVQNSAARPLTCTNRRKSLHLLPGLYHVHYKIMVLAFRALHGQAPVDITELLQPYGASWSLRASGRNLPMVPRTCFRTRGDSSFKVVAPRLEYSSSLTLLSGLCRCL